MRILAAIRLVLVVPLVLAESPALAQTDVEVLRREMDQMRKQFETMKDAYEKSMNQMTDRLRALEEKPPTPAPAPVAAPAPPPAVPTPGAAVTQAPPGSGMPSLMDLARPRQPFALYD